MRLDLDFYGDQQVARDILNVGHRAHDARPVFDVLADYFVNIAERQFGSEGRFASGGWKALAESTVRAKAAAGLDPRILHATLALRNSLTKRGDENMELVTEHSFMLFRSKLPYHKFHQLGTVNMPRRRPIELTKTARANTIKVLQRYLTTGEVQIPGGKVVGVMGKGEARGGRR